MPRRLNIALRLGALTKSCSLDRRPYSMATVVTLFPGFTRLMKTRPSILYADALRTAGVFYSFLRMDPDRADYNGIQDEALVRL